MKFAQLTVTIFNSFGVRFGVRFSLRSLWLALLLCRIPTCRLFLG